MSQAKSPFYPPRARWQNPVRRCRFALRRALHLEVLNRCPFFARGWFPFVLTLIVPGGALWFVGLRKFAALMLVAYLVCLGVFLARIGYQSGHIAAGLMIGLHASSAMFSLREIDAGAQGCFKQRFVLGVAMFLILTFLIYFPLSIFFRTYIASPLEIQSGIIVINVNSRPDKISRGDAVAYRLAGFQRNGVLFGRGLGFDKVLAVEGDAVRFGVSSFEIDGVFHQRLPYMPNRGELTIPENKLFIWPTADISTPEPAPLISDVMTRAAVVDRDAVIGRPFKWWFWRKQMP